MVIKSWWLNGTSNGNMVNMVQSSIKCYILSFLYVSQWSFNCLWPVILPKMKSTLLFSSPPLHCNSFSDITMALSQSQMNYWTLQRGKKAWLWLIEKSMGKTEGRARPRNIAFPAHKEESKMIHSLKARYF